MCAFGSSNVVNNRGVLCVTPAGTCSINGQQSCPASTSNVGPVRVRIEASITYKRVDGPDTSSTASSRGDELCGPIISVTLDNEVVFVSASNVFRANGVVSGEIELDVAPGRYALAVDVKASKRCTGAVLQLAKPSLNVLMLGRVASQLGASENEAVLD